MCNSYVFNESHVYYPARFLGGWSDPKGTIIWHQNQDTSRPFIINYLLSMSSRWIKLTVRLRLFLTKGSIYIGWEINRAPLCPWYCATTIGKSPIGFPLAVSPIHSKEAIHTLL